MDIIKVIYEEPAALEILSRSDDPDARRSRAPRLSLDDLAKRPSYARYYLAGADAENQRVGLTAVSSSTRYTRPLVEAVGSGRWFALRRDDSMEDLPATRIESALADPKDVTVLVCASLRPDPLLVRAAAGENRRSALEYLRRLLDLPAVLLYPEPAHDGFDWSLFSGVPLLDRFRSAFASHPDSGVRRFLVPYRRARSESSFYFDRWQLDAGPLPDHIEEI